MQGWYNICKSISVIHHTVKKMKDETHMIISLGAEKAFDKIQHLLMIKTLSKVGIEGTYLNIIKTIYDKSPASIIPNVQKLQCPFKTENKKTMSALTSLIQHSTRSCSYSNQTRRRNKRHLNWKGRHKTVIICR